MKRSRLIFAYIIHFLEIPIAVISLMTLIFVPIATFFSVVNYVEKNFGWNIDRIFEQFLAFFVALIVAISAFFLCCFAVYIPCRLCGWSEKIRKDSEIEKILNKTEKGQELLRRFNFKELN